MKHIWEIKDFIDLEYFFNRKDKINDIYQKKVIIELSKQLNCNVNNLTNFSKSQIIRKWLEIRIDIEIANETSKITLPGDIFYQGNKLLWQLSLFMGIITGAILAFSLLAYTGNNPVNVFTWLGVTVLLQMALLIFLLTSFLLRKFSFGQFNKFRIDKFGVSTYRSSFSILYKIFGSLFVKIILYLKEKVNSQLSFENKVAFQTSLVILKQEKKIYSSIFYWLIFIFMQLFGIGFNIGVLLSTFLRVATSDIAFGWQSTIQFSSQMIYDFVKTISIPWSWYLPEGIAFPSLLQIEGSKMILKDGISHLSTNNLVSWWPFLCMIVLIYGLLPRVILIIIGFLLKKKAVAKVDFSHGDCEKIIQQLQTFTGNLKENLLNDKKVVVLIPDELFNNCSMEKIKTISNELFSCNIVDLKKIGVNFEEDLNIIKSMNIVEKQIKQKENNIRGVIILQEAWQPPINECLNFIKQIRKSIGCKTSLIVKLIGKPNLDTIFTQVNKQDADIWKFKLISLNDPWLRVEF